MLLFNTNLDTPDVNPYFPKVIYKTELISTYNATLRKSTKIINAINYAQVNAAAQLILIKQ